ncbi:MAG: hypothetical protein QOJ32_1761 [Frankiaceae bacterium]|nr:hypothetical protein [Frankiaceae bacterium]
MQANDLSGLGKLTGRALSAGTSRIGELHANIASRVFRAVGPLSRPVQVVHDRLTAAAYGTVAKVLDGSSRGLGEVAARRTGAGSGSRSEQRLADHPTGRVLLAVLNGAHGDLIEREIAELALPMALRIAGHDLPAVPAALAGAYPEATPRLAVFLHGLVETEDAWRYRAEQHHGDRTVTYGSLLHRDLGYTPVWVRYNTGLRISDNGRLLDALLDALVEAWPVPVEDVVLIGHSMGGLVARSALHTGGGGTPAGERRWPGLVRDTITLGSPHLGAPLEQGANVLTHLLGRLGETRPLANVLAARSVGIKDLRYGNLIEDDWQGHDPDALLTNTRTDIPLHDGARHFAVVATLAGDADAPIGDLLGDLLVRPRSACGDSGDDRRMAFPADHIARLAGLHHFDLLNHPRVYEHMLAWLRTSQPERQQEPGSAALIDA